MKKQKLSLYLTLSSIIILVVSAVLSSVINSAFILLSVLPIICLCVITKKFKYKPAKTALKIILILLVVSFVVFLFGIAKFLFEGSIGCCNEFLACPG